MIYEIKAPNNYIINCAGTSTRLFLAGSIDQGKAANWQAEIIQKLKEKLPPNLENKDVFVFNPRRESWDPTWAQTAEFEPFAEQVNWELNCLELCETIVFVFDPNGLSPVTLLELGLFAKSQTRALAVVCPEGYWRKGNVDIVCARYKIPMYTSIDNLIDFFLIPEIHNKGLVSWVTEAPEIKTDTSL